MISHRVFLCDGTRPDNEVVQEALDWVAEDKTNRSATIQGKGNKTKIVRTSEKTQEESI